MVVPMRAFEDAASQVLDEALADVGAERLTIPVSRVTACGSAVRTLLGLADGAALLVIGSGGRGSLAQLVLGSVSERCAQDARCPVTIVPASG
jgi:nucleotide-binding universal stress UspA family protein